MKFCRFSTIGFILLSANRLAFAEPSNIVDQKTLFTTVSKLEKVLPFKQKGVEEVTGCKLGNVLSPGNSTKEEGREYYESAKSNDGLVAKLKLIEFLPPTDIAKGVVVITLNKTKPIISEKEVRATFGKPADISDGLNMGIPESGQPKALMYRRKWGDLVFFVSKTPDHRVQEVLLEAIAYQPLHFK
jgi:hypothetical protein